MKTDQIGLFLELSEIVSMIRSIALISDEGKAFIEELITKKQERLDIAHHSHKRGIALSLEKLKRLANKMELARNETNIETVVGRAIAIPFPHVAEIVNRILAGPIQNNDLVELQRIKGEIVRDLIRANWPFVLSRARRLAKLYNKEVMEVANNGFFGLLRAIEGFDPHRGVHFTTYAKNWIHAAITRAIHYDRLIHIPSQFQLHIGHYAKLGHHLQRQPNLADVVDWLGVKANVALDVEIWGTGGQFIPTQEEKYIGRDDRNIDDPLSEMVDLPGLQIGTPADQDCLFDDSETLARIEEGLCQLSPREEKLIRMRFGIGEAKAYQQTDIAERFGLSRQRIQQIEVIALQRLAKCIDRQA